MVESLSLGVACRTCWERTRIFTTETPLCPRCGRLLASNFKGVPYPCRRCDEHHFDRARAVGVYEHALVASVLRLKSEPHLPRILTDFIADALAMISIQGVDVIVPVPLSRKRQIERGFNQASVIAQSLRRNTGVRTDDRLLSRTTHTSLHRAGMDDRARAASVKGAFEASSPDLVKGLSIVLVDDVMTSGATLSQCALELKKAGAASVSALTLARTG